MKYSVTVVVPVYNEEASLPYVMPGLIEYCHDRNWKLMVVEDGSTDATPELLKAFDDEKDVSVIHHKVNRGYGGALKTGIARTSTEFLVTIDADGQHQLSDIDALQNVCRKRDADMVVGNRGQQASGWYREVGKWIIRRIVRVLLPIPIQDVNSGMKFYRTSLAQRYAPLCPDGMAFSDVMTLSFISDRHLVVEHPITVNERRGGASTVSTKTAFDTVLEILNIVTLFSPMRIFLPMSLVLIGAGLAWGLPIIFAGRGLSVGAMLGISTGIICFCIGLLAEILSTIRKSKIY